MPDYPLFIPEFVLCTNSSSFWFKIANELNEFRNYLHYNILFFVNKQFITKRRFSNTGSPGNNE